MESKINMKKLFFPYRMWQQIFILLVLLVLIPLALLAKLIMDTSQKAIKTSVLRDRQELVMHTTGEVKAYIQNAKDACVTLAALLGTLPDDLWRQETAIVELALHHPEFQRISLLNLAGEETVTSQLGSELRNRAHEEAFQRVQEGEVEYISDVKINEESFATMTLAVPIKRSGKVSGILLADVSIRGVWQMVDQIRIGESGRAYLVDSQGRLLSHPDKKLIFQPDKLLNPIIIRNILSGYAGEYEEIAPSGKHWLIAYAPIDVLNWGLVIFQPVEEAFVFSKVMRQQSWKFIVLIIFSSILISFLMSHFLSRPIHKLISAMQRVSVGNLDERLDIARKDEIGELFESFNRMTVKLKEAKHSEKLSTIGKAATAIAHELKNSLVMVNAYIDLLPERHMNRKFIQDFSKNVSEELDSWKAMLQNMMEYSKFFKFRMEKLDVNELMVDIKSLAYQRTQQKGVDLMMHAGSFIPPVIGNAAKLKEVLTNLINNAVDATSPGGVITLSMDFLEQASEWGKPHVRIQVIDSGEGIAEEDIDNIFEPFYTTKESGLGLGLAISKKIIEYHGGTLEAMKGRSKGAVFTIRLPILKKFYERRNQQGKEDGFKASLPGRNQRGGYKNFLKQ